MIAESILQRISQSSGGAVKVLLSLALVTGDKIHERLTPKKCPGGISTSGTTAEGPYRLIIERGRRTLTNPPDLRKCRASELAEIAQKENVDGAACSGTCPLCEHQVWATNGSRHPVTNSGWMNADTL